MAPAAAAPSTRSVCSYPTTDLTQKERDIEALLSQDEEIDLWKLRELALTDGGLVSGKRFLISKQAKPNCVVFFFSDVVADVVVDVVAAVLVVVAVVVNVAVAAAANAAFAFFYVVVAVTCLSSYFLLASTKKTTCRCLPSSSSSSTAGRPGLAGSFDCGADALEIVFCFPSLDCPARRRRRRCCWVCRCCFLWWICRWLPCCVVAHTPSSPPRRFVVSFPFFSN